MKIIGKCGNPDIATVYLAELDDGSLVEFVESCQPPIPRDKKWVLIVSTLKGCPVGCIFCDAGNSYSGKLSYHQIISQIDYLIKLRFPDGEVKVDKFKIQFARVGDPAFNPQILEVIKNLPSLYKVPSLIPSISSVAPYGCDSFFESLIEIKNKYYSSGRFQLQFSAHTTDEVLRDRIIPIKKWDLKKIAQYGQLFYKKGDRKIILNFALAKNFELSREKIEKLFNPDIFIIKVTPVNPTISALKNNIISYIDPYSTVQNYPLLEEVEKAGYEVLVSIGELEENKIGSNCGQFIKTFLSSKKIFSDGYNYPVIIYK